MRVRRKNELRTFNLRLDPLIVARFEFLEWTPENRLRHARFAGIRKDRDTRDVVRENAH
jgi:ATP-dependent DNA ligase